MIDCIAYRWSPGLGDPSIFGWITVALYIVAAAMSLLRARDGFSGRYPQFAEVRFFWAGLAFLLALMAVNKQFDFQTLFTTIGRCAALDQGWYGDRQGVQRGFIMVLIAVAGIGGAALLWLMRNTLGRLWLVLTGLGLLIFFVLMRASSFHHMDIFINTELMGLRMNWVVEMGALALIIIGARRKGKHTEQE